MSPNISLQTGSIISRFIGILLEASSVGVSSYHRIANIEVSYPYQVELKTMLAAWQTQGVKHTVVLSADIEQWDLAAKAIIDVGHICWIYPQLC